MYNSPEKLDLKTSFPNSESKNIEHDRLLYLLGLNGESLVSKMLLFEIEFLKGELYSRKIIINQLSQDLVFKVFQVINFQFIQSLFF